MELKKIEWNKVTWYSKFLAVILFILTFCIGFILGSENGSIERNNSSIESIVDSSVLNNNLKDGKYCFYRNQIATKTEPYSVNENITLNINNKKVTGVKIGTQKGPDMTNGYTGDLSGTINNNKMELVYSYTVEGSKNKELEVYELKGGSLIKFRWPLVENNKMLVPDRTGDPKVIPYLSKECISDETLTF